MTAAEDYSLGLAQDRDEARRAEEQAEIEAEDAATVAPESFVTCVCRNGQHRSADWWGSLVVDQGSTDDNHKRALKFVSAAHVVRFGMTVVR